MAKFFSFFDLVPTPKLAIAVWLLVAFTIGVIEYVTYVRPNWDLASNGITTYARLKCYPGDDCHHTKPFVYTYSVGGRTCEITRTSGKGTRSTAYAPSMLFVTYAPADPNNSTLRSAATNYKDSLVEAVLLLLFGATIVTACLLAYVQYGSGYDVTAE